MANLPGTENLIVFGEKSYQSLNKILREKDISKVFVLCDENTQEHCVPFLFREISVEIDSEIIEIESGEDHKTIETCQQLWNTLSDLNADRQSLIINLGGGSITDIGGFVASTFLRGISFINIPTSLLGMVDAAIGGKNGVNRNGLKNQIGVINLPILTVIDIQFLGTLPQNQLRSGLAEMLKHGLIADEAYWHKLADLSQLTLADLEQLVKDSVEIKTTITSKDRKEKDLRKLLNFGHTLGHAIETYCMENIEKPGLLHGEAIAIGMILESFLSVKTCGFPEEKLTEIKSVILGTFEKIAFSKTDIEAIIALLKYDKKNSHGKVNFTLLKTIGKGEIDCQVSNDLIYAAFQFYAET